MNIRKTDRGACRTCDQIAYDLTWGKVPRTEYYEMLTSERQEIDNRYEAKVVEFAQRNKDNLFAMDATTASGRKTEIICRTHLQDLLTSMRAELGEQDESN